MPIYFMLSMCSNGTNECSCAVDSDGKKKVHKTRMVFVFRSPAYI